MLLKHFTSNINYTLKKVMRNICECKKRTIKYLIQNYVDPIHAISKIDLQINVYTLKFYVQLDRRILDVM